jgi:hypothetical protein
MVKINQDTIDKNPSNYISSKDARDRGFVEKKKHVLDTLDNDTKKYIAESEYNKDPNRYKKVPASLKYKAGTRNIKKRT